MKRSSLVFWNVDTQKDFVEPEGRLYVSGAEQLKLKWKEITGLAGAAGIKVVNSADHHYGDAEEISTNPDFVHTFPAHCLAGSEGAGYIEETKPEAPFIIPWEKEFSDEDLRKGIESSRNIVLLKNVFDVFEGNPYTHKVVEVLAPRAVVVYGVTTNVCVDYAVKGLLRQVSDVMVLGDGIRELPGIPLPFDDWKKLGCRLITLDELKNSEYFADLYTDLSLTS